ncbi:MAG: VOC family protein [Acidobacteriia bacterium]|nr:VOC family protein [Terriglobia bacterium]
MRLGLTILLCSAATGQLGVSQTTKPAVIGILNYPHAVNDLDTTVAFYKDVFGLELSRPPNAFPNPGVPSLVNAPGISLRLAMYRMPGAPFVLELTHFSGVERKPAEPREPDPGAADLQLRVRDIDAVFEKIKKSGAPIITRSGAPVKFANSDTRAILVRDPDGYILEVMQTPPPANAPAGMVHSVAMGLTVDNMEATEKFYHEMLGFEFMGSREYHNDEAIRDLVNAPAGADYRQMSSVVPGTNARVDFYEWRNVPRKKFHLRVYDPGAPALVLRVNDLDGMLKRLRNIGTEVISARGEIVQFGPTTRNIFVVDPNGVNIELYETKN